VHLMSKPVPEGWFRVLDGGGTHQRAKDVWPIGGVILQFGIKGEDKARDKNSSTDSNASVLRCSGKES